MKDFLLSSWGLEKIFLFFEEKIAGSLTNQTHIPGNKVLYYKNRENMFSERPDANAWVIVVVGRYFRRKRGTEFPMGRTKNRFTGAMLLVFYACEVIGDN